MLDSQVILGIVYRLVEFNLSFIFLAFSLFIKSFSSFFIFRFNTQTFFIFLVKFILPKSLIEPKLPIFVSDLFYLLRFDHFYYFIFLGLIVFKLQFYFNLYLIFNLFNFVIYIFISISNLFYCCLFVINLLALLLTLILHFLFSF